jgi:hypothetical protein
LVGNKGRIFDLVKFQGLDFGREEMLPVVAVYQSTGEQMIAFCFLYVQGFLFSK